MPRETLIQHRSGTKAAWDAVSTTILDVAEIGVETPVDGVEPLHKARFKIGDGVTSWADLPYQDFSLTRPLNADRINNHRVIVQSEAPTLPEGEEWNLGDIWVQV